jgi:hypothetical protein
VWLGLAIEYKSTQLNQKLRHACIIQFTLTVTDPNNLLLVGANHPKCFDCPSKIHGQVSLHLILPTNFKNPALGVALVSPMPQKNTFFLVFFHVSPPNFDWNFGSVKTPLLLG